MGSFGSDHFAAALSSNKAWAVGRGSRDPGFFKTLAVGQKPSILWLGCSDSRCPETTILGLDPGTVFAHRNVANVVAPGDASAAASVEYAVDVLQVRHIVLCGHSGCGGVAAVLGEMLAEHRRWQQQEEQEQPFGEKQVKKEEEEQLVLGTWLAPLRWVRDLHGAELLGAMLGGDEGSAAVRLAELNVETGVRVLLDNVRVRAAVSEGRVRVHGCLFDIATGRVRELSIPNL